MTVELTHKVQVRAEWRQHWPLVVAAAFGFSLSALITAILGLFIEPWSAEFGWGRALMSSGVTMVSFATFFLSPFVGALIDRIGTRRIALPGIVLLALAITSLSLLDGQLWLWFAIWSLFTVAALATQPTVWTAGVASAFDAGRGVALGLTVAGSALSQTIAPTLTNFLMEEYGWRMALRYIALGWGGIAFLLCFFLLRDGYDASRKDRSANQAAGAGNTLLHDAPGLSIPEAWRSGALWRIGISTFVTMIVTVAVLVHQIPILLDVGVSRQTAVLYVGMAALAGFLGKLITGWLLDRYQARWVGGLTLAANVITFILLLLPSPSAGIVFAAMFINGYVMGTKLQISAYLTSAYAGMRNYGAVFGVMASLISAGSGVGPLAGGYIYDLYQTYDPYLWFCIGASLLSAYLIYDLPDYPAWVKRPHAKQAPAL